MKVQTDMGDPATPYVKINERKMVANQSRIIDYCARHCLRLRPHAKTHKSRFVGELQVRTGAVGLTFAKPSEAVALAGIARDVLIAFPVIDVNALTAMADCLPEAEIRIAIDTPEGADAASAAAVATGRRFAALIDLDVGLGRTGTQSPRAAVELARYAASLAGIEPSGLFLYPGHVWAKADNQHAGLGEVSARLAEAIDLFGRAGFRVDTVSGGSTPTAYQSHLVPQLTEIRPGTYIFNDMNTVRGGYCAPDDCAANVVATVVSNAVPGKVVIDAGTKTLTSDRNVTQPDSGFGHVVEFPLAKVVRLSEEHGEIDISSCDRAPRVGQRLHVIPNHICPCINLRDELWLAREDGSLQRLPVEGRGKVT